MDAPAPRILELQRVSKRHPRDGTRFLFQDVDLTLPGGTTILLSGPSGAGKSTFLNLLAGLDRPDSGAIRFAGREVGSLRETARAAWRGQSVGYVFQHHLLPGGTRVGETVAGPLLWACGLSSREALRRAEEMLEIVELRELSAERVQNLSGGQRQRVAIARALVTAPPLLLADEPSAQLDRETGQRICKFLRDWAANHGATLAVVSHEADRFDWRATRCFHLEDGVFSEQTEAPAG